MDPTLTPLTLIASGAYSSSAGTITGTPVVLKSAVHAGKFLVRVATAPTTSNPTAALDVYLQHSVDYVLAGPSSSNFAATWDDFLHFTQSTNGTAAAASQIGSWTNNVAPSSSMNMHAPVTASLAAGQVINGGLGSALRAQAVISGTSPLAASSSAWNFAVYGQVSQ